MIKILPTGTAVHIRTGLKPVKKKTVRGRLGEGARDCDFDLGSMELKARWRDNGVFAELISTEELFVRDISIVFRLRSAKPGRDTSIWTTAYDQKIQLRRKNAVCGSTSSGECRKGAWAFWISADAGEDGVLLSTSSDATIPVLFEACPRRNTLTVTWRPEQLTTRNKPLNLPTISITRGPQNKLVESWQRSWQRSSAHQPSPDRRIGWFDAGFAESQKDIKEVLLALKSRKFAVDWYAIGPEYASEPGDWLAPTDVYRDRMGGISRTIAEQAYVPALRLAPFLVSKRSQIAENRDWFVQSSNGTPVSVPGYGQSKDSVWVLDLLNKQVQDHILKTLAAIRDRWGYRAFVFERLNEAAIPGLRSQPGSGPMDLWRQMSALLRDAVGPRVFMAAEGLPLLAGTEKWDAKFAAPAPIELKNPKSGRSDRMRQMAATILLHRSTWSDGAWANAFGPVDVGMFGRGRTEANCSLIDAMGISLGSAVLTGDPRDLPPDTEAGIHAFLALLAECRRGEMRLAENTSGGRHEPLIVKNSTGRIGIFNFSNRKRTVRLAREELKASLGVGTVLSAGNGAVFNSPEIHVTLPPRSHRLFKI